MSNVQSLKAQARLHARNAPKPDPAIAKAALAEAKAAAAKRNQTAQPTYRTQTTPSGKIAHRGSGVPMCEFSDPSSNTVRAIRRLEEKLKRA